MGNNRIANLRIDADKTQKEITELLNCQREVHRRYEKEKREIPLWAALKLAKYYNITLDYLLGLSSKKRKFGE